MMKAPLETHFRLQKPKKLLLASDPADASCLVSGSLALVLRVSRAALMSPLSVTGARAGWRVAPSASLAVLQALIMTAFNLTAAAGLVWDFSEEPEKRLRAGETTLKAVVWISDLVIMMILASVTIYSGTFRMRNLIQVLKQLQQINFDLKISPPSAKSEKFKCFVIICIVALSTALQLEDIHYLTESAYYDNKNWPVMCPYSVYYYTNIVQVMVALQWYFTAKAAYAASSSINRQLQQLLHVNFKSEPKPALYDLFAAQSVCALVNSLTTLEKTDQGIPIYAAQAQATVRRLALSYDRIGAVVVQLTAYNGFIMLLMILSYWIRLVLSPYYLLLELFNDDIFVLPYVVLQIMWILYLFINLTLVVEPCQWTQDQRDHTRTLLSQLMVHLAPQCERLAHELEQFAKQVQLSNAKFMPLGIFTLSRPLIVTILGSVTTYLLIIIQFQKISDQL